MCEFIFQFLCTMSRIYHELTMGMELRIPRRRSCSFVGSTSDVVAFAFTAVVEKFWFWPVPLLLMLRHCFRDLFLPHNKLTFLIAYLKYIFHRMLRPATCRCAR